MFIEFFNIFAWWRGVVIIKNKANSRLYTTIEGKNFVIHSNEQLVYKPIDKLCRVSLQTNDNKWICENYVVQKGLVYGIHQDDYDAAQYW